MREKCENQNNINILENLNQFINSKDFLKVTKLYNHSEIFIKTFNYISNDINLMMQNKEDEISYDKEKLNGCNKLLYRIIDMLLLENVLRSNQKFFLDYVNVMYNWYVNMNKNNPEFEDKYILVNIKKCNNLIEGFLSLSDQISVLKALQKRIMEFINYEPPAFKISQHYLNVLNDIESPSNNE